MPVIMVVQIYVGHLKFFETFANLEFGSNRYCIYTQKARTCSPSSDQITAFSLQLLRCPFFSTKCMKTFMYLALTPDKHFVIVKSINSKKRHFEIVMKYLGCYPGQIMSDVCIVY